MPLYLLLVYPVVLPVIPIGALSQTVLNVHPLSGLITFLHVVVIELSIGVPKYVLPLVYHNGYLTFVSLSNGANTLCALTPL